MILIVLLLFLCEAKPFASKIEEKRDFCENLHCSDTTAICGIRQEGEGFRLRLFESECELLKYGCKVETSLAFGVISMDYCENSFGNSSQQQQPEQLQLKEITKDHCTEFDCSYPTDAAKVCGIRKYEEGFRIRIFDNKCQLWQHNCENEVTFTITDIHICDELKEDVVTELNGSNSNVVLPENKHIVIVDSSMINYNNFNESIENFFAATHVFDLPMKDVHQDVNETSRRMLINIFGPAKVFKPWITIPRNISDDFYHQPTLSSCYHKCPKKCPDTYAPVCGVPGIVAREPNLMFQNHCFMDVAQCKMYWEDKSATAISSNYIESSFLFCLGDELNGLYRFLPLIRTLQHMGRLKKKGHFRYKLKNMRFFNNLLAREPNLMG